MGFHELREMAWHRGNIPRNHYTPGRCRNCKDLWIGSAVRGYASSGSYLNTFRDSIMSVSHCIDNYVPGFDGVHEFHGVKGLPFLMKALG